MVLSWLSYYVWLQLTAFATLPLSVRVFRALPDRGYGFSKLLGLLGLSYAVWVLGMLGYLQHSRATLVVLLVVLAAACWATWGRELRGQAPPRPIVLACEALFLLALAGGGAIRAFNADINGQEKFMDLAFMNAFFSAGQLPAEDPWLAGFGVPYYHFGYLVMASMSELAGVAAPVGYNLALVLTLALTLVGCASLVFNMLMLWTGGSGAARHAVPLPIRPYLGPFAWALLAAVLVGLVGNLEAVLEVLAAQGIGSPEFWRWVGVKGLQASAQPQGWPLQGFNWFRTSRVIPNIQPDGISEFPYFSFLLGDLHPHYQALPYDLLVLELALCLALAGRRAFGWPGLGVSALALGSILVANTWDVPTFWLVFAAGSLWAAWREGEFPTRELRQLGRLALPFGLAIALFLPYFVGFTSQRLGLALVAERTYFPSLLIVLGPFLGVVLLFGLWGLATGATRAGLAAASARLGRPLSAAVGLVVLGLLLFAAVRGEWTLLLLGGLLALLAPLGLGLAGGTDLSPSPSPTRGGE
ncbi:MAG: hypothetical protein HY690_07125, partial [Chloroflexi bacterium]|nr:hypothetical protein [Chloroflexota bacterium]